MAFSRTKFADLLANRPFRPHNSASRVVSLSHQNGTSMSANIFLCMLQRIVLSAFTLAMSHAVPQDGNLISEIGNLFGEVLRELNGEEPKPAAAVRAMVAFEAPQPKLLPGEADRKEHANRTLALRGTVESWVIQTCQLDETQQARMKELAATHLKDEIDSYAKRDNPARQNRPFGENTPLLFVQSDGVGTKLTDTSLTFASLTLCNG